MLFDFILLLWYSGASSDVPIFFAKGFVINWCGAGRPDSVPARLSLSCNTTDYSFGRGLRFDRLLPPSSSHNTTVISMGAGQSAALPETGVSPAPLFPERLSAETLAGDFDFILAGVVAIAVPKSMLKAY
ncbi:MAG: hypothetical protein ACR2FI_12100 [Burkholderiales bacterium]